MLDPSLFIKPIAHRGLHDEKKGLVENSSGAFLAAINKGYGIECDLRPLQNGQPVVFHDETLKRLLDKEEHLSSLHLSVFNHLRYRVGGEKVLTFVDFLSIVGGRVPILVEVKSNWGSPDIVFLSEIARSSLDYKGPLALMSFDPDVMTVLKELAVEIPRGLISGGYHEDCSTIWEDTPLDKYQIMRLADLEDTACVAPSFYAYNVHSISRNTKVRFMREVKGLPIFSWTVRTRKELEISREYADAPIFEGIEP